jgi:signal transduction histidine kinase
MEDREQPFAAFVLEVITHRGVELGQWWTARAQLAAAGAGDPDNDGDDNDDSDDNDDGSGETTTGRVADRLVRTLLDAVPDAASDVADDDGAHRDESHPVMQAGSAIGTEAHRRNMPLHQMLEELDLLAAAVLRTAEQAAAEFAGSSTGREGLAVARRIAGATSLLRLAAAKSYAQAVEGELRERYRAIRHGLRNPLGTLKSAIALLTDENVPADLPQRSRVRAMVVRNASSLDQMISEALGDAAARLSVFGASAASLDSPGSPASSADRPASDGSDASGREQRDDVARRRQRPDLESGAF